MNMRVNRSFTEARSAAFGSCSAGCTGCPFCGVASLGCDVGGSTDLIDDGCDEEADLTSELLAMVEKGEGCEHGRYFRK
jgi:hypothetical protein